MRAVLRQRSIAAAGGTLALSLGAALSVATTSGGAAVAQPSARPMAATQSLATTVQPTADCTIYSGSPTSSATCGAGSDDLVGDDGNGNLYRTMISFPEGLGIPAGSHILSSTLTIDVAGAFGSTPTWVFQMTRGFAPRAATWNAYDGVHSWSTAGGDYSDSLQASATVAGAGVVSFSVTPMTQAWADGSTPIPELMMLPYAGAGNAYSFANQASGNGPYLTIAYQPPANPTAPTPPVVTTPVSTPVPTAAARRSLKIKLVLSWTWNRATTRLHGLKVGSLPGDTRLSMTCRGRGCPRRSKTSVTGARTVRRTLRSLAGRRYRAGDVLTIRLTAPGYRPEQAEVVFRAGKLPLIRPLRRS